MKWFRKLIYSSCLCCGEIATKDVKEIPSGERILYDLVENNHIIVSRKRFEKIHFLFFYNHLAKYPLCINCYAKVEAKLQEDKALNKALYENKKKELKLNEYYEKLALETERKELEVRAKAVGIDLDKDKEMFERNNN